MSILLATAIFLTNLAIKLVLAIVALVLAIPPIAFIASLWPYAAALSLNALVVAAPIAQRRRELRDGGSVKKPPIAATSRLGALLDTALGVALICRIVDAVAPALGIYLFHLIV